MKMKVYVNIPAGEVAGGVESLYQLVDSINSLGGYGCVIWDKQMQNPVPAKYSHYHLIYGEEVEEHPDNWIIYPEVWTEKVNSYPGMKNAIWWLSVDNNHGKFRDFTNDNITHFYQSFYALSFLQENGARKSLPLFDYINSKYLKRGFNLDQKENIVCYNPLKGIDITNQIKSQNTEISFLAISGMNENQVIETLARSKVYIDFGHHPGRDRIPRESAILGNCVITNHLGSAGFYNDIPIESKYKISDFSQIGDLINKCFGDFGYMINDYSLYRSSIINQKEQMQNLVKQYFL
jgi:hypothetical protein